MKALKRGIAFLVLAGFVSAQGAVWVAAHHADLEDDAACAAVDGPPLIGPHRQAGRQFEDTNPPSPIEHCALCHLQRAVSSAQLARIDAVTTTPHVVSTPAEPPLALSLAIPHGFAPRGPPSFAATL